MSKLGKKLQNLSKSAKSRTPGIEIEIDGLRCEIGDHEGHLICRPLNAGNVKKPSSRSLSVRDPKCKPNPIIDRLWETVAKQQFAKMESLPLRDASKTFGLAGKFVASFGKLTGLGNIDLTDTCVIDHNPSNWTIQTTAEIPTLRADYKLRYNHTHTHTHTHTANFYKMKSINYCLILIKKIVFAG